VFLYERKIVSDTVLSADMLARDGTCRLKPEAVCEK
jgi:hypothetical protein